MTRRRLAAVDHLAWLEADLDYDRADAKAIAAMRAFLTPGSFVWWRQGVNLIEGEVIGVSAARYRNAQVKVRSRTGKEYWIYVSRILAELEGR